MSWMKSICAITALASAVPAWAHGDGLDARGAVVEASANTIVLKTPEGETRKFTVNAETEVRRGKAPVTISDIAPGEKAIVHAKRSPEGRPLATSIKLSSTKPPSTPQARP